MDRIAFLMLQLGESGAYFRECGLRIPSWVKAEQMESCTAQAELKKLFDEVTGKLKKGSREFNPPDDIR